jgi:hypothetical protein
MNWVASPRGPSPFSLAQLGGMHLVLAVDRRIRDRL